jgi:hypothetical protein
MVPDVWANLDRAAKLGLVNRRSTTLLLRLIGLASVLCVIGAAAGIGLAEPSVVAKTKCLVVPAPLTKLLRSSLAFSAGGQLFYTRAAKSPALTHVYFISAQIRSSQLGSKRPLGTWAVDKLAANATASPINAAARAYSDLATPDAGTIKLTMRTPGATASQACVAKLVR